MTGAVWQPKAHLDHALLPWIRLRPCKTTTTSRVVAALSEGARCREETKGDHRRVCSCALPSKNRVKPASQQGAAWPRGPSSPPRERGILPGCGKSGCVPPLASSGPNGGAAAACSGSLPAAPWTDGACCACCLRLLSKQTPMQCSRLGLHSYIVAHQLGCAGLAVVRIATVMQTGLRALLSPRRCAMQP